MRCQNCILKYPNDKQKRTYHPALLKVYTHHHNNVRKHVGYYCVHCNTLFKLKVEEKKIEG
jgi:hypothetical protein